MANSNQDLSPEMLERLKQYIATVPGGMDTLLARMRKFGEQIGVKVVKGDPLSEPIPDDSFTLYGRGVPKKSDFVFGPDGLPHPIVKTWVAEEIEPEFGVVAIPAHYEKEWITINAQTCPVCKHKSDWSGWWLDTPPEIPNAVVLCENCGNYHWIELPNLRAEMERRKSANS